jgi:hypothetical protein
LLHMTSTGFGLKSASSRNRLKRSASFETS